MLHALDLGMLGDWDGAKRSLQNVDDPIVPRLSALLTDQQRRERERAEMQAVARHELANAISIAQANMEALVDGVLEPTPERLASIRDAMIACGMLLEDFKKQSRRGWWETHARMAVFDVCELISSQVDVVRGIAESKSVHVRYEFCAAHAHAAHTYRGDPDGIALILRDVLLGAVRFTPPGGTVGITCPGPNGEIEISVCGDAQTHRETLGFSLASKLLEALGGHTTITTDDRGNTKFALRIPAVSC